MLKSATVVTPSLVLPPAVALSPLNPSVICRALGMLRKFVVLEIGFQYIQTGIPGVPVLPLGWSSTSKCITEASTGRALVGNSFTSQSLSLDQCIDLCDQTGFQYAGAEVRYLILSLGLTRIDFVYSMVPSATALILSQQ
jgi:hypothetical protein